MYVYVKQLRPVMQFDLEDIMNSYGNIVFRIEVLNGDDKVYKYSLCVKNKEYYKTFNELTTQNHVINIEKTTISGEDFFENNN